MNEKKIEEENRMHAICLQAKSLLCTFLHCCKKNKTNNCPAYSTRSTQKSDQNFRTQKMSSSAPFLCSYVDIVYGMRNCDFVRVVETICKKMLTSAVFVNTMVRAYTITIRQSLEKWCKNHITVDFT